MFQWNHATKLNGKIGVSVPQLCLKGSVHPSTFKSANLVPQLLFSGQAHPYAYVALHDGMGLMRKVILPLNISSSHFLPLKLETCTYIFCELIAMFLTCGMLMLVACLLREIGFGGTTSS